MQKMAGGCLETTARVSSRSECVAELVCNTAYKMSIAIDITYMEGKMLPHRFCICIVSTSSSGVEKAQLQAMVIGK